MCNNMCYTLLLNNFQPFQVFIKKYLKIHRKSDLFTFNCIRFQYTRILIAWLLYILIYLIFIYTYTTQSQENKKSCLSSELHKLIKCLTIIITLSPCFFCSNRELQGRFHLENAIILRIILYHHDNTFELWKLKNLHRENRVITIRLHMPIIWQTNYLNNLGNILHIKQIKYKYLHQVQS